MCWPKYNSSLSKSLKGLKFYIASEYIKYNTVSNSIIETSNDVASTIKSDTSGLLQLLKAYFTTFGWEKICRFRWFSTIGLLYCNSERNGKGI